MIHFHKYRRFETTSGYYIKCTTCTKRRLISPKVSLWIDGQGREFHKEVPAPPMWLMRPPLDSTPEDVVESEPDKPQDKPWDADYIFHQGA